MPDEEMMYHAIHEAAHAVWGTLALRWRLERISIQPNPKPSAPGGWCYGRCVFTAEVDPRPEAQRDEAWRRCSSAVAGIAGIAVQTRTTDAVVAGLMDVTWYQRPDAPQRVGELVRARARLVPHWADPDPVFVEIFGVVSRFLQRAWPAVEALGAALREARTLDGPTAFRTLWRAIPRSLDVELHGVTVDALGQAVSGARET